MSNISEQQVISVEPMGVAFAVSKDVIEDRVDNATPDQLANERLINESPTILRHILKKIPLVKRYNPAVEHYEFELSFVVFTPEQAKILMQAWREKTKDDRDMFAMLDAGERKKPEA